MMVVSGEAVGKSGDGRRPAPCRGGWVVLPFVEKEDVD